MMRPRRRIIQPRQMKLPKWVLGVMTVGWWGLLVILILTVEPERIRDVTFTGLYFPLLLIMFLAVSMTLFLFRKKLWPSILWALVVSIFIILRILGWGNFINLAALGIIVAIWEIYWHRQNSSNEPTFAVKVDSQI